MCERQEGSSSSSSRATKRSGGRIPKQESLRVYLIKAGDECVENDAD